MKRERKLFRWAAVMIHRPYYDWLVRTTDDNYNVTFEAEHYLDRGLNTVIVEQEAANPSKAL